MPQVFILFSLVLQNPDVIFGGDTTLFWVTFGTSILSASKGIATLLKEGPCKLVPNQGVLGGYGQIGFILVFVNIAVTLLGKGLSIGIFFTDEDPTNVQPIKYMQWACLAFLPNLIFVRFLVFFLHFLTFG